MSDWVYGFFMAWGMFLAIPCPKKIWRESARRKMLACLPLVGCIVGGVWALCACLVQWLPGPLAAALLAAAPWLVTGFLHLDGFMDVCDAVLSRRDLETRRRILKDSHCGAFAVICMVLLAMGQWSAFLSARSLSLWGLALIPGGQPVLCIAGSADAAPAGQQPVQRDGTGRRAGMVRGGVPDGVRGAAGGAGGELCPAHGGGGLRPGGVVRLPAAGRNVRRYIRASP